MAKEPSRTYTDPAIQTGGPLEPTPKAKGKGKWKITAVMFLVVLPLAAFALWVTIALNFAYASGERAGVVRKLSNKGWVCKTWEGELALASGVNVLPEIFAFTVRDAKVAEQINNSLGNQVKLSYEQHKGVPTQCFGETEYYVKEVQVQGAAPTSPATAPATAPATTAPVTPAPTTTPPTP
ncbi:MAG TPA: hypothetical protein VE861_03120 [Gemmatimonadaceae bacterium]|nr:hypothetical protein [Gemmatimonadaceae bacterium]